MIGHKVGAGGAVGGVVRQIVEALQSEGRLARENFSPACPFCFTFFFLGGCVNFLVV